MWLTETPWPPSILVTILAIITLLWGYNRSHRGALIASGVLLLLIPAIFVVERLIVTPGEEVEALVHELRDAVVSRDIDRTLSYFSEQIVAERLAIGTGMGLGYVKPDVSITDLSVSVSQNSTAESHFRANGTFVLDTPVASGERHIATRWNLLWRREAGDWKIYAIDRLNPITGEVIPMLSAD